MPEDHHRLTMYGQTGSGKTVAALWHLALRSWTQKPWLIFDFKEDEHIAQIPGIEEVKPGHIPQHPGLYVTRPVPESDDDDVATSMWGIWNQRNTGVFVDEGYMVSKKNTAFKAILTQGRSRGVPLITLSQRPVWMTRFAISEADFHQVFFLADDADRDVVQRFIPHDMEEKRLPKFHSYYYDVGNDDFIGLKPVPSPQNILDMFERRRLKPHKHVSVPRFL
jgi:hypothetical protein